MRAAQISQNQANISRVSQHQPQLLPPQLAHPVPPLPPHPAPAAATMNPAMMDIDHDGMRQDLVMSSSTSPGNSPNEMTIDPRIQQGDSHVKKNSSVTSQTSPGNFSPTVERLDDFLGLSNNHFMPGMGLSATDFHDADAFSWSEYPLNLDPYATSLPLSLHQSQHIPLPAFPELSDISSNSEHMSSSRGSEHTRSTSIMSTGDFESSARPDRQVDMAPNPQDRQAIPEFNEVIASEAAWPLARCNPLLFSGSCPRTAKVYLNGLENCRYETTWKSLDETLSEVDWDATDMAPVVPMAAHTRDEMLASTQIFLRKALEIHRSEGYNQAQGSSNSRSSGYFVLPSAKILEYFLRSYVRNLSFFYSLVMAGSVDPNEMIQNGKASTLLVLLMVAQGASAIPTVEARALSSGLIETCRISLFDIIEKDIEMSADPTALRSALLFMVLGSWSGDKWLMDITMGQRGMYLSQMLKHAGMFESQPPMDSSASTPASTEVQWRSWLQRESQNRLAYNFVMVDQELGLFHDTGTMLSTNDICCPLPGPELLWMSTNADQWSASIQSIYGNGANASPELLSKNSATTSLRDLFQDFLYNNLSTRRNSITPHQLRLLLHPLQSYLYDIKQMLSCFPDVQTTQPPSGRTVTKDVFQSRLTEAQELLQAWYELSLEYHNANPNCPISRTNLVLYHLISLNAVTNFPEIEKAARRENPNVSFWDLSLQDERYIRHREEAVFRCGQVFRLIRSMPHDRRPGWWSVAVYRVTLILWMISIARPVEDSQDGDNPPKSTVAIDRVTPEDPLIFKYMWQKEAVPVLTLRDGATTGLDEPRDILDYAVKALDEGHSTRLGDGIKRKLIALDQNWQQGTVLCSTSLANMETSTMAATQG
ncbi:hypothetical protein Hte_009833 [Hypoxylon texense]